jgi:hypothetical protein
MKYFTVTDQPAGGTDTKGDGHDYRREVFALPRRKMACAKPDYVDPRSPVWSHQFGQKTLRARRGLGANRLARHFFLSARRRLLVRISACYLTASNDGLPALKLTQAAEST